MICTSFSGSQLTIENKIIDLKATIKKVLEIDDKILVLVDEKSTREKKSHGNIYAFNFKGEKLWSIQAANPYEGWYRAFTGIYVRDGVAIAYSPIGIEYEINLDNGKLINLPGQRPW